MNIERIQRAQGLFSVAQLTVGAVLAVSAMGAFAQAKPLEGKVVKLAWIDPQTGLMGPVGNNS